MTEVPVDRAVMLLSYWFWRQADVAKALGGFPERPLVFADSGGYSASTAGADVDIHDYAAWLKRWDQYIDVACTLDVVGDAAATERNTRILEEHGCKVVPVFHVGEPWDALHAIVDEYDFTCIGGMVPWTQQRKQLMRWILECMRITSAKGLAVHGLGLTHWRNICDLPLWSADSSSWTSAERFGDIRLWDPDRARTVLLITGKDQQKLHAHGDLLRFYGLDPAKVAVPRYIRQAPDKPLEVARAERRHVRRANIKSWALQLQWWRNRFGPVTATGLPPGPHLFIVVLYQEQIDDVGIVIHGDDYTPLLPVPEGVPV